MAPSGQLMQKISRPVNIYRSVYIRKNSDNIQYVILKCVELMPNLPKFTHLIVLINVVKHTKSCWRLQLWTYTDELNLKKTVFLRSLFLSVPLRSVFLEACSAHVSQYNHDAEKCSIFISRDFVSFEFVTLASRACSTICRCKHLRFNISDGLVRKNITLWR